MDTLHTAFKSQLDELHPISQQNRAAAASAVTSGELYLLALNLGLAQQLSADQVDETIALAADRCEKTQIRESRTAFSTGSGACQVREFA